MHQDQGYVPLPHPPFPLAVLMIWLLSDFSYENGGTYVVPGSHIDEHGNNHVRPDVEFEKLAHGEPGLCALKASAGHCFVMDARVLHSGGRRLVDGTRFALRNLYIRGFMRQQENMFLGCADEIYEKCSPKLRALMGYTPYQGLGMVHGDVFGAGPKKVPIGELSMERPDELNQDFDWKHSVIAQKMHESGNPHAEYLGPRARL